MSDNYPYQLRSPGIGKLAMRVLVVALLVAACGSDASTASPVEQVDTGTQEQDDPSPEELVAAELATDDRASGEAATGPLRVIEMPEPGAAFEGRVAHRLPVLSGIEIWVDSDDAVSFDGEFVLVEHADGSGVSGLALTSADASGEPGAPIATVDDFVDSVESAGGFEIEATGERIEFLGVEMLGYRIDDQLDRDFVAIFSPNPRGFPGLFAWAPTTDEIFLGETPNGVLSVAAGVPHGHDVSGLPAVRANLESLLPTIRFTGPGLSEIIDYGQVDFPPGEPSAGVVPAPPIEDGPVELTTPFSPLEPGTYQFGTMGTAISASVEATDWWVQPFFPGFSVFAQDRNPGPGIRDLVLLADLHDIAFASVGPGLVGEPRRFERVDELIADPPAGLLFDDVVVGEIGGRAVTSFTISVASDALCTTDDPCIYAFISAGGEAWFIKPGSVSRAWFFEDDLAYSLSIFAGDLDIESPFLDEAEAFVKSFRFPPNATDE